MSQNITLLGASYSDVPSVVLPKTGGGTAAFTDVTDTTAEAADVAEGKYFYTSSGVRTAGTSSGGGGSGDVDHWVRPSDWPDLSKLDRTGEVVYISCLADERFGNISLLCRSENNAKYVVEMGDIVGNTFVPEYSWQWANNATTRLYFGAQNGGYKVFRVTPQSGTHLTSFAVGDANEYGYTTTAMDDFPAKNILGEWNGVLEVYGNLPYLIYQCSARTCKFIQSFDVKNITPNTLNYAFAWCYDLVNVDVSTWDTSNCTNFDSAFRGCPLHFFNGYKDLDLSKATTLSSAFEQNDIYGGEFDMTNWNMPLVTTMNGMFSNGKIRSVKLKNSDKSCIHGSMFSACSYLEQIDLTDFDSSNVSNMQNMFLNTKMLWDIDFGSLDLSSLSTATNTSSIFNGSGVKVLTIPDSLSIIGTYTFSNMELCTEYHFLATTPPTLNNSNAFNNMNNRFSL